MKKKIIFGQPSIGNEEINYIKKVIKSKWIGSGKITEKFESNFRKYKSSKFALSVNSCTAALHLSLLYCGVKRGHEVITTPMTFASTINSIAMIGAKPILADINPETFNIDPKNIERCITKKTKAILIVHLAGLPCEIEKIMQIAKKYKLKVIEDCAHAIESKYNNKHVGNFGDAGCFSFYSTKNLTTGEGGMIICNNKNFYKKVRVARLHGLSKDAWKRYLPENVNRKYYEHYDVTEIGFKYNMIDINSAMGIIQLKKLENNWKIRKNLFKIYKKKLSNTPVNFQKINFSKIKHAYHLLLIVIEKKKTKKKRDELVKYLNSNGIGIGINYRTVTDMSIFKKKFGWNNKTCPNSKYLGDNTLSLPVHPKIKKKEALYICEKVKEFFSK